MYALRYSAFPKTTLLLLNGHYLYQSRTLIVILSVVYVSIVINLYTVSDQP